MEIGDPKNVTENADSNSKKTYSNSGLSKDITEFELNILKKRRNDHLDKLIFGNFNINSISSKFDQMEVRLQGNIDILVFTETKLDSSFSSNQFILEGYSKHHLG